MSRSRRVFLGLLCCALLAAGLVLPAHAKAPVRILASTFPVFLMVRNVVSGAEAVAVELMLPPGMGCPHDYALTPQDMRKLTQADILVINGLGLEEFIGVPLKRANPSLRVVDSSAGLGQLLSSDGHDEDDHPDGHSGKAAAPAPDTHEPGGTNPHIFSSPRMAARMTVNIASQLALADPANADLYRANAQRHAAGLNALADALAALGAKAANPRIATQSEVFDYFARDAGLTLAAEIPVHAGREGSAADMLSLIARIKGERASFLLVEPRYAERVGTRISRETGIPMAAVDPVDAGPDNAPLDYYEQTMRRNLAVLARVLRVATP